MTRNTPNLEPIRTYKELKTEEVDKETPKYEPIRACEEPKTEKTNYIDPTLMPGFYPKVFPPYNWDTKIESARQKTNDKPKNKIQPQKIEHKKDSGITFESPNTDKAGKEDIASRPDDTPKLSKPNNKSKKIDGPSQKPKDKPKNKIEPRKIDIKKEPKHKIQRAKFVPKTQPRNKIEPRKINPNKEPNHKLQPRKINTNAPPRHKIDPRKIDNTKDTNHKIQPQRFKNDISKNKIKPINPINSLEPENINEWIPIIEPKNVVKHNINKAGIHKAFNDGKQKECGRCHQVKKINEFEQYMANNKNIAKTRHERYCRPCRLEYKQIRAQKNKTNIIRNIYGGKFREKCPDCNTTVAKLPAFDFHHPIKELKTKPINFHGNWKNVLKRLEKEKVVPSCRNCHLEKQPKYYNKYKKLIEHKNKFETSLEGIEGKLYKVIYKQHPI
jgi:hypothetical protein